MQGRESGREERERKRQRQRKKERKTDHSKFLFSEKESGRSFINRNERKGMGDSCLMERVAHHSLGEQ